MQLNISELDDNLSHLHPDNDEVLSKFEYEKIPENSVPINVIKKTVHFDESILNKPLHQPIPKQNAKIIRQQHIQPKPKISYEDILSKMGMLISDGKLHLLDKNTLTSQQQYTQQHNQQNSHFNEQSQNSYESNIPKNSYIYNKYFKNEIPKENNVIKPKSIHEYKMMLIDNYLQRNRIKQMKSKKLIMPTSNINIASGNSANLSSIHNKLFNFSKR